MNKILRALCVGAVLMVCAGVAHGAEPVRVSVFGLFHPRQITVESSHTLVVRAGERELVLEPGQKLVVSVVGGRVTAQRGASRMSADRILVTRRDGSEGEITLGVPGKIRRKYQGDVVVQISGNELVPVVSMELETAVASVNAAEATPGAPMEALKAQAVAVRSYLVAGGPRHKLADFCDTTHCQFLKSPPKADSLPARAAAETRGLVLAWEGKTFAAMYSASCSGRTHSLNEIGYTVRDYPYFAVECDYCRKFPERWAATLSEEDAKALASKSEAERVRLGRRLGWNTVPSVNYSEKKNGGAIDLAGVGRGHGLGLCQRGAVGMAREGKNFREILEHYYPNTTLKSVPQ
ncbi:MAG TPA: SpoIID/LytB domain-containing protein [Terriglobales bacterium]